MIFSRLTRDGESSILGSGRADVIACDAPVGAGILFLLRVHDSQEEEGAGWEGDPVGLSTRLHRFSIFEPFDHWVRLPLRLAVQRHRLVLSYRHVRWMFRDPRTPVLT